MIFLFLICDLFWTLCVKHLTPSTSNYHRAKPSPTLRKCSGQTQKSRFNSSRLCYFFPGNPFSGLLASNLVAPPARSRISFLKTEMTISLLRLFPFSGSQILQDEGWTSLHGLHDWLLPDILLPASWFALSMLWLPHALHLATLPLALVSLLTQLPCPPECSPSPASWLATALYARISSLAPSLPLRSYLVPFIYSLKNWGW